MSSRGRQLFDKYVRNRLNHPDLASLGMTTHVFNLLSEAGAARIQPWEITEEVGPVGPAFVTARNAKKPV